VTEQAGRSTDQKGRKQDLICAEISGAQIESEESEI